MKELVVISGKGGTGKTSIAAALALLAERPVVADCDVDAADLHLLLAPEVKERHEFISGHEAVIRAADCTGCGKCAERCRFDAIEKRVGADGRTDYKVDPVACEGCGVCVRFCPAHAIDSPDSFCGEWMVSETRIGPMVHARLAAAAENSGKLVSLVRKEARRVAEEQGRELIIVDGPPGIGCPVIASLTGAHWVLVVTEPTVSGEHDMARVLELAAHFGIPAAVCVNKYDINLDAAVRIESVARDKGAFIVGRIPYDRAVTEAQILGKSVVETGGPAAEAIQRLWGPLKRSLDIMSISA
ncbi:MAG TPA: ATP-binding protein [bacterium]|nr:ATP-binding protein [bacterium]